MEGHFKQRDRDREHELLFPKPGYKGGEKDVLEICQEELVVLACSVLMMILMTENTAPALRSTGEEISPQTDHPENTPEPDDIRGFKGLMQAPQFL